MMRRIIKRLRWLLVFTVIFSCTTQNSVEVVQKVQFEVFSERNGDRTTAYARVWGPVEEEPIISFNGIAASKDYNDYGGQTGSFRFAVSFPLFWVRDSFSRFDTLRYSILYAEENYQGEIFLGDTLSNVTTNDSRCTLRPNSSRYWFDPGSTTVRDTIVKAPQYEFVFGETALYCIRYFAEDTAIHWSRSCDTVFSGDRLSIVLDSARTFDMLVFKYLENSWVSMRPKFTGKRFIVYQETYVDRKRLSLFMQ
jgi:hypothetical protein